MILIVDDDSSVRASLGLLLKQSGRASHAVASPEEALDWLRRHECQLVLQDMNFSRQTSGEEGLALLREIKALRPTLPVVLIPAWGSIALAVEGMKAGASDFVTKPWTNPQLLQTVETALVLAAAPPLDGPGAGREELDARYDFAGRTRTSIGTLRDSAGSPLTGIDAGAYVPSFQNIFAFWTDAADGQNKLVYVDCETASATVIADNLDGGRITDEAQRQKLREWLHRFIGYARRLKIEDQAAGQSSPTRAGTG